MKLYRGDSDKYNKRNLRDTIKDWYLFSNVINQNNIRGVSHDSLKAHIHKHVDEGWKTTNMLSFSEDKNIALSFGMGVEGNQFDEQFYTYGKYCENENDWDFVLIEIDGGDNLKKIDNGVWLYQVEKGGLSMFDFGYRALFINVVEYLAAQGLTKLKAFENAKRDKEWLVFPITRMGRSSMGSRTILDSSCITDVIKYKRINQE